MLSDVLRDMDPSDDISDYLEDAIWRGEHTMCSEHGQLPIHIAAIRGLSAIFIRLLEADPESALKKTTELHTPLLYIINGEHKDSAMMLKAVAELCPAALSVTDDTTMLHRAIQSDQMMILHPECVNLCIDMLPDAVRVRDYEGAYPLNRAVRWLSTWAPSTLENTLPIILRLAEAYPEAMTVETEHEDAPIHFILMNARCMPEQFNDIIIKIINVYPEAAKALRAYDGKSPLEIAVSHLLHEAIVAAIIKAHPEYLDRPMTKTILQKSTPMPLREYMKHYGYTL